MGLSISINDQAAFNVVIGIPGPVGPVGPQGPIGPAGQGVPVGGTSGQVLAKVNGVDYNTEWITPQDQYAVWGGITGTLSSQTDLQTALDAKLSVSSATSTYLPLAGGYITGDIQSSNGSGYRTWDGLSQTSILLPNSLVLNNSLPGHGNLSIDSDGITFYTSNQKQTQPFLGLAGYATEAWVTAGFYPLTGNPSGFLTSSSLTGYATESWVTSQLGSYLTTASAASTYQPLSGMSSYLTTSDAALTYYPLTNPSGFIGDAPADGTTYGRKDGVWSAVVSSVAWGSISGDIVNQLDLQAALDAKYDASNPAGFITAGDLSGYATESWVNSQGFLTTAILDGYAQLAGSIFTGEISFSASSTGRLVIDSFYESGGDTYPRFTFGTGSGTPSVISNGDFWFNGTYLQYGQGGIKTVASQSWVTSQGYITSSALTPYALLSGATFTGKINAAASNAGSAGLNLGAGTAPTLPLPGDVWTASNTDTLRYRAPLTNQTFDVAVRNATNTFTSPNVIDTTSNTLPALRVTQKGTQPVLVVEDSVNPDANALVVDTNGNVGIGVPIGYTAVNKVEIVGAVQAQSITFDGTAQFKVNGTQAHAVGANTHDLLISFNGSTYRVPMIFVSTP